MQKINAAVAILSAILLGNFALAQDKPAPAAEPATHPSVLPGNGLNQHPFLYAGEWDTRKPVQTLYIIKGGKVAWDFSIPSAKGEISDASLLSNGNVIIAHQHGAKVVGPDKKVIWSYDCPTTATEVHTIQAIGLNKVVFFENGNPAKVKFYDIATNTLEKSFEVPVGNAKSTHGQVRRMHITPAGTLLIAQMDANAVNEFTMDGKNIATIKADRPWDAVRLKNGNTLMVDRTHVLELDPKGEQVWTFAQSDLPQIKLFSLQEANRLDNGNTVITSWVPNSIKQGAQWTGTVQAIEVTPDKKLVWALDQWSDPDLGPATNLQLLDQSGTADDHTMQR